MLRFALGITAVEILLIVTAATLVSLDEDLEPYLTSEDLRVLRIPFEKRSASYRGLRLHADHSWDARATLLEPRGSLYVTRLFNAAPEEYTRRLTRERALQEGPEKDRVVLIEEPFPGETGFAVRHRGATFVRIELVRMRGGEVLVIHLREEIAEGSSGKVEVAQAERRARLIQDRLLQRFGWR